MLIFISGSINSGKTTTSKILADKLDAAYVNVDYLNDSIPNFNLSTDLDKSMDLAVTTINKYTERGINVVANYVVREKDWDRIKHEININTKIIFTLSPRLEVA